MNELLDQGRELWQGHGAAFLTGAGAVGLVALLASLVWVKATKKRLRPGLIWLSANLALLLNAEGMYEVLTEKADLPPGFVWLVFFVFEIMLLNGEAQVAERYRATTIRGADGKVSRPGEPGPMLAVVWAIALLSGVIVATNAGSLTEAVLRLALPLLVVWMWWATLTAEGYTSRRSRFAHSPRRVLERYGWLIADRDEDLERMAHQRRVARAVRLIDSIDADGYLAAWSAKRFRTLARTLSDEDVEAIDAQVARTRAIVARYAPAGQSGHSARAEQGEPMPDDAGSVPGQGRSEHTGHGAHPGEMIYWPAATDAGRAYGPELPEHIIEERRETERLRQYMENERARRERQREENAAFAARVAQQEREAQEQRDREYVAQQDHEREEREREEKAGPPKGDRELLDLYADQLVKERGEKGELSVYRVRKVCAGEGAEKILSERQGKRLHEAILARYAAGAEEEPLVSEDGAR